MRRTLAKASFHTAANLLAFTLFGTLLLAWVHQITKEPIEHSIQVAQLKLISQIVPVNAYDNRMIEDKFNLDADELLGTTEPSAVYRARLKNQPAIAVLQVIAPDGYSGKIRMIVAIHYDGSLSGVRVVNHKETPGLGDYIDISRSDWVQQFNGISLSSHPTQDWKVKKDGGQFDYMAGATITPRAAIKAVHKTLQYYQKHRDTIWSTPVALEQHHDN